MLRGVTIAPSTGRVAEYFALLGSKPISNAVDASNFVLQGMGHPTHAFDLDKIEGGIIVRLARKGEKLKLLDGTERTLEADDLVVADHAKPLGLAGVMGGWDSMITAETKNILVEAAWFDPACVRRSSRRHGLHTDASHRFERGADFNACATGQRAGGEADSCVRWRGRGRTGRPRSARDRREDRCAPADRVLGGAGAAPSGRDAGRPARPIRPHRRTGLAVSHRPRLHARHPHKTRGQRNFSVQLPSWRLDLEREIDLVEEVARVYGYNRFANTLPTALPVVAHPLAAAESAVRTRLLALGYSEAISSTFASEAEARSRSRRRRRGVVALENPLSEEARLLRPSLVPGMLAMLAHNLNRDVREARLFEQGAIFTGTRPS